MTLVNCPTSKNPPFGGKIVNYIIITGWAVAQTCHRLGGSPNLLYKPMC